VRSVSSRAPLGALRTHTEYNVRPKNILVSQGVFLFRFFLVSGFFFRARGGALSAARHQGRSQAGREKNWGVLQFRDLSTFLVFIFSCFSAPLLRGLDKPLKSGADKPLKSGADKPLKSEADKPPKKWITPQEVDKPLK